MADLSNDALHLLNARGELLQLLMTKKDGLVAPYSLGLYGSLLWIGTDEGKVIVAEYKAQSVLERTCTYNYFNTLLRILI